MRQTLRGSISGSRSVLGSFDHLLAGSLYDLKG